MLFVRYIVGHSTILWENTHAIDVMLTLTLQKANPNPLAA